MPVILNLCICSTPFPDDVPDALPDAMLPDSPVHISLERRRSYSESRPLVQTGSAQSSTKSGVLTDDPVAKKAAQLVQEEEKEVNRALYYL
jgi:hypothetical protein